MHQALKQLANALFGRSILTSIDFNDISVEDVPQESVQDSPAVRVQFTVSADAVGKVLTDDLAEAIAVLQRRETDLD